MNGNEGDLNLALYRPILDSASGGFLADLGSVPTWRRSIRAVGGFWQGSFAMPDRFRPDMVAMFHELLGAHLVERSPGGETWQGMIYELELSHNGVTRRRSLDQMMNAIEVLYSDESTVNTLGFTAEASSIARYGRREAVLSFEGIPSATATAHAARMLALNAWPRARPVSVGEAGEPALAVRACGYVFTANWLLVTQGDGAEQDLDHWISAIVGSAAGLSADHGGSVAGAGDCQYLTTGVIRSNTLQVRERVEGDLRPWSLISELCELGDANGDPWVAWVDADRALNYEPADLEPQFYLRDRGIYRAGSGSLARPFELGPGVFRDLAYPIRREEPGSAFADARDLWVDEIEVGADGSIALETAGFDEAAILAAQLVYERQEEAAG